MGTITKKELNNLFAGIDAKLKNKIDVFIIGGAFAILGYNATSDENQTASVIGGLPQGQSPLHTLNQSIFIQASVSEGLSLTLFETA